MEKNYGCKINYFIYEIIKTHSTVAFSKFYTTHFFRQFVALKRISQPVYIFMQPCMQVITAVPRFFALRWDLRNKVQEICKSLLRAIFLAEFTQYQGQKTKFTFIVDKEQQAITAGPISVMFGGGWTEASVFDSQAFGQA